MKTLIQIAEFDLMSWIIVIVLVLSIFAAISFIIDVRKYSTNDETPEQREEEEEKYRNLLRKSLKKTMQKK